MRLQRTDDIPTRQEMKNKYKEFIKSVQESFREDGIKMTLKECEKQQSFESFCEYDGWLVEELR